MKQNSSDKQSLEGQGGSIESYLAKLSERTVLRFSTAGSVDDGKSTLIGRLLYDSKSLYEDHVNALHNSSIKSQISWQESLAYLTDGLRSEREQGITIDVAYRYFSTPRRHFILADTPGHEQYTRNMATGSSTANLTILLVDARKGVITQTKRHAFIASLLGIPRFLVAINKMDLVDYSEDIFRSIQADFKEFASKLGIKELRFIPISALEGDNVVTAGDRMPWYHGETVMEYLEEVYVGGDVNLVDFRFPVQHVVRPDHTYRGYAGQIASGMVHVGEEVIVVPSMKKSKIASIDLLSASTNGDRLKSAFAPMSVTLTLEDEIDISRGDMLVRSNNVPKIRTQFEGMVVWMHDQPMDPEKPYIIMHTTRQSKVFIDDIKYKTDVNTLHRLPGGPLELNEIGRISFNSAKPLLIDPYDKNRSTGSFILVEPGSYLTVAAGMIIDRLPQELMPLSQDKPERVSTNIHLEEGEVTRQMREKMVGANALTFWFTGLSGSGKSSIAKALEQKLYAQGRLVYRLDGDNLRFGLNRDLGFSRQDRTENIRRAAEVARLLNQAGVSVICSFISPFEKDRSEAKEIVGTDSFVEVFVDTPLEVCESRDPNGLYKKARAGEIREFTGISSPYEEPAKPDVVLPTADCEIDDCVRLVMEYLSKRPL